MNGRHYGRVAFQKPREIAVRVLQRRDSGADYIENLLGAELSRSPLTPADRGLAQELVYGVIRWQAPLDWLIDRKTGGRQQKPLLQIILRLGLYQLFWLDRVPDHAAVNESVELARRFGCGPQSGFVNAVLRGYVRDKAATSAELETLKTAQPAVGLSHPAWLVERWTSAFGSEETRRLLAWNNTPPQTFARINTLRTSAADLADLWTREGVKFEPFTSDWVGPDSVWQLIDHPPFTDLKSFNDGLFYVQDPSTLLAVGMLDPQPGETVLDLCAAPGGKTTLIAARMKNQGRIVAVDSDPERLKMLAQNCARLGVECVEAHPADAFKAGVGTFDRVLIDAPCSNTGVVRRRVDLRWRVRLEEIERLAREQNSLLEKAASLIKPGGSIVYSTCSLEPEENSAQTQSFLANHAGLKLESERQLAPWRESVDGAYAALIR